jgi:acetyl esterase/lipase
MVAHFEETTMNRLLRLMIAGLLLAPWSSATVQTQATDSLAKLIHIANTYRVVPNITYLKTGSFESKLDVYQARGTTTPNPTLIFIHGGNWVGGSKEASSVTLLPFLDMGWNIVNVDYRLVDTAPAPAAVEDCRCALRWVYQHAKEYNIDSSRLVASGNSAGGHLAMLIGMVPDDAGFDGRCPGPESPKLAAIVNWYGFPDLADLLEGANLRPAVVTWIGVGSNRMELAKRLSPITYLRPGLPPVLTVHGDADPTSPYVHAVRLHEGLTKAGVPNQLVTVPGGKHGGFTDDESVRIYSALRSFLTQNKIGKIGE